MGSGSALPSAPCASKEDGGFDGMLKAYDAGSGDVLWSFNTNDEFPAIAGGVARAEARGDLPPRPMVGGSPAEEGGQRTLSQREKMAVMGVAISISSEEEEGEVSGSEDGEVQVVNVKRSRLR